MDTMMYNLKRKQYLIPVFILAALAVFSLVVMLLWNAVIPDIFHLPEITFVQAILLLILSRLLFGGTPFRHPAHSHPSMIEKFRRMSPEEREEFKKRWSRFRQPHPYNWDRPSENQSSQSETEEK
jgi:hypothetical protein